MINASSISGSIGASTFYSEDLPNEEGTKGRLSKTMGESISEFTYLESAW